MPVPRAPVFDVPPVARRNVIDRILALAGASATTYGCAAITPSIQSA